MTARRKHLPPLHVWFHCYADGAWQTPTCEFLDALDRFGLGDMLTSFQVGFVGSDANIAAVLGAFVDCDVDVVAMSPSGWEQETLQPLWEWSQDHDGLVGYAHTKGASRSDPIDSPWRRDMLYHNIVDWHRPVDALISGKYIAGAHWYESQVTPPGATPGWGNGGMFGGNFWWTRCELLRQNRAPSMASRMHAEHWLGQLSEVMPITSETIEDLCPGPVTDMQFHVDW